MDFLLWATRSLHLFSIIVWIGGLLYQAAVIFPAGKPEEGLSDGARRNVRRFVPFMWMSVSTTLITGVALMLFSPRFLFFEFNDRWSVILALKQMTFLLMVLFSFGHARMFQRIDEMLTQGVHSSLSVRPFHERMLRFGRINIALSITAILLTSALR